MINLDIIPLKEDQREVSSDSDSSIHFIRKFLDGYAGSCYASYGNTKVAVVVDGPKMIQNRGGGSGECIIECEIIYSNSVIDSSVENNVLSVKSFSEKVRSAVVPSIRLSLYPKCTMQIQVLVIESGDYDLSLAINCTSMALLESGVELFDIVTSCTHSTVKDSITVAYMSRLEQSTLLECQGRNVSVQVSQVFQLVTDCKKVRKYIDSIWFQ